MSHTEVHSDGPHSDGSHEAFDQELDTKAIVQITAGQMLGTVHYNQLGQYERKHFSDNQVKAPLKTFKSRIDEIGEAIDLRNHSRHPYMYLTPQGIPQSINI